MKEKSESEKMKELRIAVQNCFGLLPASRDGMIMVSADKYNKLAEKNNVKGQVGHVERFNPAFTAVKNDIKNPMFIETHRLAEFNPRGTDVPVVLDLMIHDIDAILSVVNSPVKEVRASGVSVISETPDIANARLEFENGCVANLTASRISMKNMRKSRFFSKGCLYLC